MDKMKDNKIEVIPRLSDTEIFDKWDNMACEDLIKEFDEAINNDPLKTVLFMEEMTIYNNYLKRKKEVEKMGFLDEKKEKRK